MSGFLKSTLEARKRRECIRNLNKEDDVMNSSFSAISAATLGLVLALTIGTSQVNAYVYYPWCALYGGGESPGTPVCGFNTDQQCMAAVSGTQGFCQKNWPPSR
jgi:hypothetical protein